MEQQYSKTACILCVKRKVKCNGAMPTCGECINESLSCRYDSATLAERIRDPLHLRDIEGRLKKMETQLARAAGNKPTKKQQMNERPQRQQQGTAAPINRAPSFSIENGGLCIETDISEAHHFLKALFRSVDPSQIQERAQQVFGPIPSLNKSDPIPEKYETKEYLLDYLMADDPIGDSWVDMVISSRHNRCFIMYQRVGQETISCTTANLRRLASKNDKQHLLFAMSLRAFVYQHENDSHQDSEYPIQTSKGYQYMECAKNILEECYTTSNRTTIRALLYLFNFHMYQYPEEAFRYGDLAVRMAQDLGLHKGKCTNEDDRRLWWAAYWCNLYASVHFERPLLILDDDIQVEFPKGLPEESLDVTYCIDYCIMSIKLLQIQKSMIEGLQACHDSSMIFQKIKELEDRMKYWQSLIPSHARIQEDCSGKDPLCIELGTILDVKFQYVKIQLYQCLVGSAGPLGLIATHNCNKAFRCVTEMLVRNGDTLSMCAWTIIIPGLHHILVTWRKITQFTSIEDSLCKLLQVLRNRVSMYIKEAQSIIGLIEDIIPYYHDRSDITNAITATETKNHTPEQVVNDLSPAKTHKQAGKQSMAIASDDPYLMQFPILPASISVFPSNESSGPSLKVDNTLGSKSNQPESGYDLITAFNQNNVMDATHTRGIINASSLQLFDGVTQATDLAGIAISDTTVPHTSSNCWTISDDLSVKQPLPISSHAGMGVFYRETTHQNTMEFTPATVNDGQLGHTMMNPNSSLTPNTSAVGNQCYMPPAIPSLGDPTAASSSSDTLQGAYSRAQMDNDLTPTFWETSTQPVPSFDSLDIPDWQTAWNIFPNRAQDHSQLAKRSQEQ